MVYSHAFCGTNTCTRTCFLLLGRALGVAALQDGPAVARLELALAAEEAGHEEVEERPQLEHVVLDGRAAEDEAVRALQLPHGL